MEEEEDNDEEELDHYSIQKDSSSDEEPVSLVGERRHEHPTIRAELQQDRQPVEYLHTRARLYPTLSTTEAVRYQSRFRPHLGHSSLEPDGGSLFQSSFGHGPDVPYTSRPQETPRTAVPLSIEEASPKGSPNEKLEECVPGTFLQPYRWVFRDRTYQPEDINENTYQGRLASFHVYKWNILFMDKRTLARAGFYYSGSGDEVVCSTCHNSLGQWERGDNPWEEHRKHFGQDCFPKP